MQPLPFPTMPLCRAPRHDPNATVDLNAYAAGMSAAMSGSDITANPYPDFSNPWHSFDAGWLDARGTQTNPTKIVYDSHG